MLQAFAAPSLDGLSTASSRTPSAAAGVAIPRSVSSSSAKSASPSPGCDGRSSLPPPAARGCPPPVLADGARGCPPPVLADGALGCPPPVLADGASVSEQSEGVSEYRGGGSEPSEGVWDRRRGSVWWCERAVPLSSGQWSA